MAHFHHFSICNPNQSISSVVIFGSFLGNIPSLQPYIFTFHKWLNQFQFWSCLALLGKIPSAILLFETQSISILVIFGSFLGKIPSLQPYILATNGSFSSVFNLQSNSINFNFGHFWLIYGQTTKAIALLFGHKWLISSVFNLQSNAINFTFWSFLAHLFGKIPRL